MRPDQVMVQEADQVTSAGATADRHDQRDLRVAEHAQHARGPALRAARKVAAPVEHTVGHPYRVAPARQIGRQPVQFARRHGRGCGHQADAVTGPQWPWLHQLHEPTQPDGPDIEPAQIPGARLAVSPIAHRAALCHGGRMDTPEAQADKRSGGLKSKAGRSFADDPALA
jgi:hypothetical protein